MNKQEHQPQTCSFREILDRAKARLDRDLQLKEKLACLDGGDESRKCATAMSSQRGAEEQNSEMKDWKIIPEVINQSLTRSNNDESGALDSSSILISPGSVRSLIDSILNFLCVDQGISKDSDEGDDIRTNAMFQSRATKWVLQCLHCLLLGGNSVAYNKTRISDLDALLAATATAEHGEDSSTSCNDNGSRNSELRIQIALKRSIDESFDVVNRHLLNHIGHAGDGNDDESSKQTAATTFFVLKKRRRNIEKFMQECTEEKNGKGEPKNDANMNTACSSHHENLVNPTQMYSTLSLEMQRQEVDDSKDEKSFNHCYEEGKGSALSSSQERDGKDILPGKKSDHPVFVEQFRDFLRRQK